jgi:hypothetical protein
VTRVVCEETQAATKGRTRAEAPAHRMTASLTASLSCRGLSCSVVFWRVFRDGPYQGNGPEIFQFRPVFIGCGGVQPAVLAVVERGGVALLASAPVASAVPLLGAHRYGHSNVNEVTFALY